MHANRFQSMYAEHTPHRDVRAPLLIARSFDSLATVGHPDAAANAAHQSLILACQCRPLSSGPADPRLCIKLMRRGVEEHWLSQRRIALDEDAYLILNGCAPGTSIYRGDRAVSPFAVFFAHDMRREALASALPEDADDAEACAAGFLEHLRPHGDTVSQRLRHIAQHVDAGIDDPLWYDEQLIDLLQAALLRERELQCASQRIASVKAATRHELLRRVLLAADFIWSNYEQAITLDDIAGAARLSRFHLVRLFRQVHGTTPHGYLMAKRLAVAERLLAATQLDLNDIAVRAGFGTRWSLFRQLRKRRGAGGEALRHDLGHHHRRGGSERRASLVAYEPCPTSA